MSEAHSSSSDKSIYKSVPNLAEWTSNHDVIQPFIDFQTREYSPVQVMIELRKVIGDSQPYQQYIPLKDLKTRIQSDPCKLVNNLKPVFVATGTWYISSLDRAKVSNPSYCHPHQFPDADVIRERENRQISLETFAQYGCVSLSTVAPRFGVSTMELAEFIASNKIPWCVWRTQGRRRLARTWKLLVSWGRTEEEVAEAFGESTQRLRAKIQRHANSFTPPDDPTRVFER